MKSKSAILNTLAEEHIILLINCVYAQNYKAVLDVITKIGLKKDSDPTFSAATKYIS